MVWQEAHRRRVILQLHQEVHQRRAGHHRLHVSVGRAGQHINPVRHGSIRGRRAARRHRSWRRSSAVTSGGPRARLGLRSPPTGPARGAPAPSPAPALTRPAPLGRLPGPRRHGSRAPGRGSSPRPPCCPRGAGLVLRSGAGGQRGGGRDRGSRARGRGSAGRGRLGVRAGAAAAHRAGGRGGEQSRFRFRSRYAHTRMTSDASRSPRPRRDRGAPRLPVA